MKETGTSVCFVLTFARSFAQTKQKKRLASACFSPVPGGWRTRSEERREERLRNPASPEMAGQNSSTRKPQVVHVSFYQGSSLKPLFLTHSQIRVLWFHAGSLAHSSCERKMEQKWNSRVTPLCTCCGARCFGGSGGVSYLPSTRTRDPLKSPNLIHQAVSRRQWPDKQKRKQLVA